jgi:threonine dehydrogenase-like Zn-dependent dehydrogenase
MSLDGNISALQGDASYPLKYGYAAVGKVVEAGSAVDRSWLDRWVFAFHPHESHFVAKPGELLLLPEGIARENAAFFANTESAVNFVMDARPMLGERVAVFGQGIVGLLTTAMLRGYPLGCLVTFDPHAMRREASLALGADESFNPGEKDAFAKARKLLDSDGEYSGADLVFELSGMPETLDQAIAVAGYNGRVVIGSWYGSRRVNLNLGGRFHRDHVRIISSQVSTMPAHFSSQWTKRRRFGVVWGQIDAIGPSKFITHRFSIQDAPDAYRLLAESPETAIQVLFTYP